MIWFLLHPSVLKPLLLVAGFVAVDFALFGGVVTGGVIESVVDGVRGVLPSWHDLASWGDFA